LDWQMNYLVLAVGAGAALVSYLGARLSFQHKLATQQSEGVAKTTEAARLALLEYKSSPEVVALMDLRYKDGHQAGSAEAIRVYKSSEGYEALMSVEHGKGKIAGMAEEKEKWVLSYTPVLISDEGFWSHTVEMGYDLQLFYSGMPVNQPIRHISHSEKKSKDENIQKFVSMAEGLVEVAASIAAKQKISVAKNALTKIKKDEAKK